MSEIRDMQFTLFVKNSDFIVRDYNLFKAHVMPNVTYIDCLYRFLISKGFDVLDFELRDIVFKNSITTNESMDAKLQISLKAVKEGFEVCARSQMLTKNKKGNLAWDDNFQCSVRFINDNGPREIMDIEALKNAATKNFDLDVLYALAREREAIYLEFMKTRGTMYECSEFGMAAMSLTELGNQYINYFFLHPAFLDISTILMYNYTKGIKGEKKPFIPVYIESFRAYDNFKKLCFAITSPSNLSINEDILSMNFKIYDYQGNINAVIKGISLKYIEDKDILGYSQDKTLPIPEEFDGNYLSEYAKIADSVNELIKMDLRKMISTIVRKNENDIDLEESIFKMGLDSRLIMEFAYRLEFRTKKKINPTIIFGNTNIEKLSGYIEKYLSEVYQAEFKLNHVNKPIQKPIPKVPANLQQQQQQPIEDRIVEMVQELPEEAVQEIPREAIHDAMQETIQRSIQRTMEELAHETQQSPLQNMIPESDTITVKYYGDASKEHDTNGYEIENTFEPEEIQIDHVEQVYEQPKETEVPSRFTSQMDSIRTEEVNTDIDFYNTSSFLGEDQEAKKPVNSDEQEDSEEEIDILDDIYIDEQANLQKAQLNQQIEKICLDLRRMISKYSKMNEENIDVDGWDYGEALQADVLMAIINALGEKVQTKISPAVIFKYKTIRALAEYIFENYANSYAPESEENNQFDDNEHYERIDDKAEEQDYYQQNVLSHDSIDISQIMNDNEGESIYTKTQNVDSGYDSGEDLMSKILSEPELDEDPMAGLIAQIIKVPGANKKPKDIKDINFDSSKNDPDDQNYFDDDLYSEDVEIEKLGISGLLFVLSAKETGELLEIAKNVKRFVSKVLCAEIDGYTLESFIKALQMRVHRKYRLSFNVETLDDLLSKLSTYIEGGKNENGIYIGAATPVLGITPFDIKLCASIDEVAQVWVDGVKINFDLLNEKLTMIESMDLPESMFMRAAQTNVGKLDITDMKEVVEEVKEEPVKEVIEEHKKEIVEEVVEEVVQEVAEEFMNEVTESEIEESQKESVNDFTLEYIGEIKNEKEFVSDLNTMNNFELDKKSFVDEEFLLEEELSKVEELNFDSKISFEEKRKADEAAEMEERRKEAELAAIEEERKALALEEERKAAALEEERKAAALEEERKAAALEEERKAAALEEERKAAALEEERKAAALEEERKVAELTELNERLKRQQIIEFNEKIKKDEEAEISERLKKQQYIEMNERLKKDQYIEMNEKLKKDEFIELNEKMLLDDEVFEAFNDGNNENSIVNRNVNVEVNENILQTVNSGKDFVDEGAAELEPDYDDYASHKRSFVREGNVSKISDRYMVAGLEVISFAYLLSTMVDEVQTEKSAAFKCIKDINWGAPIKCEDEAKFNTNFMDPVEDDEDIKFYAYSVMENGFDSIHLSGKAQKMDVFTEYQLNIDEICARLIKQKSNIYDVFKKSNISVSPSVKCIKEVYSSPRELLARISSKPDGLEDDLFATVSMFEGVVQSLYALMYQINTEWENVSIPYACREINLSDKQLGKEYYVHIKEVVRMKKEGIVRYNVAVLDLNGEVVAKFKDFILKLTPCEQWYEKIKIIVDESTIAGEVDDVKDGANYREHGRANEPIAIIGISGNMPMSKDLGEFYDHLIAGKVMVGDLPTTRKDYSFDSVGPEFLQGGYIEDVESFDAEFFGIKDDEAHFMDPQQRMLIQNVWNAIEDAGYRMSTISNQKAGVFVGVMSGDYSSIVLREHARPVSEMFAGIQQFYLANRISKIFDFRGPSEVINTGYASSISSIKRAVDELHNGSCEVAVVGAVNLCLNHDTSTIMDRMGLLSRRGVCSPFDIDADGFVRSEGIGVMILKPLSSAIKNSDNIYGVIKGISVGHGGGGASLAYAGYESNADVIVEAWEASGMHPMQADYFEMSAHGVPVEDKSEVKAVVTAIERYVTRNGNAEKPKNKINIGSVKSYVGDLEASAGMVGTFNILMSMKYGKIPGVFNLKEQSPDIAISTTPFELSRGVEEWTNQFVDGNALPKVAALNSIGMGGVSGHMVLQEYINTASIERKEDPRVEMFVFSAKNKERLLDCVNKFVAHIKSGKLPSNTNLEDISYTLQLGRESMDERLVVITETFQDLMDSLHGFIEGKVDNVSVFGGNIKSNKTKFVPIFDGEEADAFVKMLMENKNYKNLAQLWILGIEFDWKQLHIGRKVWRTSLPGYQFKGQKYWFSRFKVETGKSEKHQYGDVGNLV